MNPSTGDSQLDKKIVEYLKFNKNDKIQAEVEELVKIGDVKILQDLFMHRMEFGTAGLRGKMGPGYSQMNDLVIIQTAQGLLHYIQSNVKKISDGLVLGYDGRFAELTASIFLRAGAKVYLYSKMCPTPFVPFAVSKYKALAGVMVTASHNPKEDNGYKVYWSNGAQIIPPHDKGITESINGNLEPKENAWDTSILEKRDSLIDPLSDVMHDYYEKMKLGLVNSSLNSFADFSITYTAMHGVGYPFIVEAFKQAKFKPVIPVVEQVEPDPEFPTVIFPNPEEGKSALDLAIKTANASNSKIILANDPDADRLAVAEKLQDGTWKVFTGNEIGALLGWWLIYSCKVKNPYVNYLNVYTLSSTVSSKILKTIAKAEGFSFEETLTGFKWMGNRAYELMNKGKHVLFAFEEAIGFMCTSAVLDKDGISAAVHVAELLTFLRSRGECLTGKLNDIYSKYGHHVSDNSYFICHQPEVLKSIFERLRNFKQAPNTYPETLKDGKYKIIAVRDLTTGYDSSKRDKKATLPVSKSSQMITFSFDNGLIATLRTSGTEPKLKYYTELCAPPKIQDKNAIKETLDEMVTAIINEFIEPTKNGLKPRSN